MLVRQLVLWAFIVSFLAPVFDHHAGERDPWHGHLARAFASPVLVAAVHQHSYQMPHAHSLAAAASPTSDGVASLQSGPGLMAPDLLGAGGSSLATSFEATGQEGLPTVLVGDDPAAPNGADVASLDPPPRPTL